MYAKTLILVDMISFPDRVKIGNLAKSIGEG